MSNRKSARRWPIAVDPPDPPVTIRRVTPAGACAERLPGRYPPCVLCRGTTRRLHPGDLLCTCRLPDPTST